MAESQSIAELYASLGVKADPGSLETLERFDKFLKSAAKAVQSFAKVADAGVASITALGASAASLAPLVDQLDALQQRLVALKGAGLTKLTLSTAGGGDKSVDRDAARAEAAAERKAAAEVKAAEKAEQAAHREAESKQKAAVAAEKAAERATAARLKQEQAADKAMDREVLAELKAAEKELKAKEKAEAQAEKLAAKEQAAREKARREAAFAAGKQAEAEAKASKKAATEAEKAAAREAAALAKVAEAARLKAEEEKKAAEAAKKANNLITGENGFPAFFSAIGAGIGIIEEAAKAMLALAASVAAVGTALIANSLSVAQDALQIERQADAIGASNEEYQKLRYTLGRFGVDAKDLADLYGQIDQQAQAAAAGTGNMADLFKKLGINAEAFLKQSPADQLKTLAEAMKGVENPAERLAIASTLLGEDLAKKLTPLLIQGGDAIDKLGQQAEELGLVLSEEDIAASEKLTSQWAELTGMVDGLRIRLGAELIPAVSDLAERLIAWYDANEEVIGQKLDVFVADVTAAFTALGNAAEATDRVLGGASGFFALAETLAKITAGLFAVASAVSLVAVGIIPFLATVAAEWGTLFLIVQDFYTYLTGGTSVIGTLIDQYSQTDTLLGALARAFVALQSAASAAFNLISIAFGAAWDAAAPFRDLLASIAEIAGGVLLGAIQVLTAELTTFLNVLTAGLNGVAALLGSAPAQQTAASAGNILGGGSGVVGAPSTTSAASLVASTLAPASLPSQATSRTVQANITIGGATINGSGLDEAALSRVMEDHAASQGRQVQAALLQTQV